VRTAGRLIIGSALLYSLNCSAREDDFYTKLLAEVGTNWVRVLTRGSLVEPINRQPDLSDSKLYLKSLHVQREIAGIRLGMEMGEVVAAWGKPTRILLENGVELRLWYDGGEYARVLVLFRRGTNKVIYMKVGFPPIDGKHSRGPTVEECLRVLGKPTRVRGPDTLFSGKEREKYHDSSEMIYEMPQASITLSCFGGQVAAFHVARPSKGTAAQQ
jgi:hypothetical protein